MRLWTRLTLGFAVTALLIVALYGAKQLRDEEADLRQAAERDLRLVGSAVQIASQNAFRDKQTADVTEIIDVVKLRDPSLDVLVFDTTGSLTVGSWGSTAAQSLVRGLITRAQSSDRPVLQFEGRALGGAEALRDLEELQSNALIRPEQVARGDAEEERVPDLSAGTGDRHSRRHAESLRRFATRERGARLHRAAGRTVRHARHVSRDRAVRDGHARRRRRTAHLLGDLGQPHG